VGACGSHSIVDAVPHRETLVRCSALPRRDTADDPRAVFLAPERVEGALAPGDSLHDHARRAIDQNRHRYFALRASSTAFAAPWPMSSAVAKLRPDSASIFRPSSTFVPSIRTTTGIESPSFLMAAMSPSASRSHRRMPPNTLMNTAFTLG